MDCFNPRLIAGSEAYPVVAIMIIV